MWVLAGACCAAAQETPVTTNPVLPPAPAGYVLAWEDDFDGSALDPARWQAVQHGDVDNGELQFYTDRPENVSVSNGCLWLTARRETYTGTGPWMKGKTRTSEYTSGKVQTLGRKTFQYGRIEARIQLPRGAGTWPAFWMLGANLFEPGVGWPLCGEIDILEHSHTLNAVSAAVHTGAYNHRNDKHKIQYHPIADYDTAFHVYGMDWTPEKLAFHVDGHVFFTVTKAELGYSPAQWPFDQPFWLILNLAVGGHLGGDPSAGAYPYAMQIDWVRVYQQAGN